MSDFLDTTFGKLISAVLLVLLGSGSSLAVLEYRYDDVERRVSILEDDVSENQRALQEIRIDLQKISSNVDSTNLHLSYQREDLEEIKELLKKGENR